MPRVKATKKQVEAASSEKLPVLEKVANGTSLENGTSTTASNGIDAMVKDPPASKAAGGKKKVTREGEGEAREKKPAVRGKKKIEEQSGQNGVQDVEEMKPKGRAKKTPAAGLESEQEAPPKVSRGKKKAENVTDENGVEAKPKGRPKKAPSASALESELEAPKKSGRGKKKTEDDGDSNGVQEEVESKPKGRAAKTAASSVEEPPTTSKTAKSRAKKEKIPVPLEAEAVAAPVKGRGRAKKEIPPAEEVPSSPKKDIDEIPGTAEPAAKKRARGGKRLADADIADVLEEVEEADAKPAAKQKRTKKEAPPAATETKGRGKKADKIEEKEEQALPSTSTKRGQKKTASKTKENEEVKETEIKEAKPARGRKRAAAAPINEDEPIAEADEEDSGSKTAKKKEKKIEATPIQHMGKALFNSPSAEFNLKISSWNVAGLRAWLKKDGLQFVDCEEPDIFCLQETKCSNDQLPEEMSRLPGYHPYWLCMPGGYAGVAIYSKIMPINVEYGIGNEEFDDVGRMITAEYEKFYLINVYVPNSGRKLVNLELRMRWEVLFQAYVQKLDALKPVVICGDMNVSHLEIDLANPKSNTRNAGFTKEERDKMSELLELGYVDTFRHLYPDTKGAYTFWTYMANARARNVGWRLDYCIVSQRFVSRIVDQVFRSHCLGSDHCPITVFLNV
ncbi:recombination repair protein 1 isoform X2 [Drosophila willistoni]|uniref:recombination repair protein 1 isoform X2 n=1 Tax=Drosophila willistoni TaxID=7260 RepID=UPI000C26D9C4|nr:recombination repair protein 1 isoform X2 [Drosophila willistoni]